jgi:NADH-quinone oxidoreductase subunit D
MRVFRGDFKVITDTTRRLWKNGCAPGELLESFSIAATHQEHPRQPHRHKGPAHPGGTVSRYGAPRQEDVHAWGNGGETERVKVRAPTLANTQSVSKMLEDGYLADLPIVIAAIDPCFSCTDRMVSLRDSAAEGDRTMSWEEVSRYGVEWHKARGIDFSRVRIPGGARE